MAKLPSHVEFSLVHALLLNNALKYVCRSSHSGMLQFAFYYFEVPVQYTCSLVYWTSVLTCCGMFHSLQVVVGHQQSIAWKIGTQYSDISVSKGTGLRFTWDTSQTSGTLHNLVEVRVQETERGWLRVTCLAIALQPMHVRMPVWKQILGEADKQILVAFYAQRSLWRRTCSNFFILKVKEVSPKAHYTQLHYFVVMLPVLSDALLLTCCPAVEEPTSTGRMWHVWHRRLCSQALVASGQHARFVDSWPGGGDWLDARVALLCLFRARTLQCRHEDRRQRASRSHWTADWPRGSDFNFSM